MTYFIILSFFIVLPRLCMGQQKSDTIPKIAFTTIIQISHGNSYITFPTDIGNIEPLWFKGNLIPNFYIRISKNSHLMSVFTPQIIIRMYQEESFPVRTPSYMPEISVYFLISPQSEIRTVSAFGKLVHHSNSQDGDFSTNCLELGINVV